MATTADYVFMARALHLAERGLYTADPNPRVGCVVVSEGQIVGEGWHCRAGEAHAEIHALRQAGERARGADVYVSLEPCCHHGRTPPCSDALIAAGVKRVVAAMEDPNPKVAGKGLAQLKQAGIEVETGVMHDEAQRLNPGFIRRMRNGRPWVRCKMAMSLDGRTALANGVSQWISGEAAREDVQHWRARSSAVVTGVGTVLADDPSLTVRLQPSVWEQRGCGGEVRQPLRVVMDTRLRTPPQARILKQPGRTWLFTASDDQAARHSLSAAGASIECLAPEPGRSGLNLGAALQRLAGEGVNEVWMEAGPTLSGAMLREGLVDQLIIYMAPLLMGNVARGLFHLQPFASLAECIALDITDMRAVGKDWRITAQVSKARDSM
jgi:diaminohydroxyphosphoribosylaminopyrimidine deaminase/5-amino-6-(5-phosphoribosylamino)uracil reductase